MFGALWSERHAGDRPARGARPGVLEIEATPGNRVAARPRRSVRRPSDRTITSGENDRRDEKPLSGPGEARSAAWTTTWWLLCSIGTYDAVAD
jgi:hypothetical protein